MPSRLSLSLGRDDYGRELLGIILMEQGELESACSLLERPLADSPPHHRADRLNNLGRCELVLGLVDRAIEHLTEARRLAPRAERPALNLAAALEARGDAGRALQTPRELVASVPTAREGWRRLGVSLEAHGDTAEALAAYQRATRSAPPILGPGKRSSGCPGPARRRAWGGGEFGAG